MFEEGIAVSLPGAQAATLRVSGSVFGHEELHEAILPPELRTAVALVTEHADALGVPVRFVTRPEIFTHGALAESLAQRIAGARDHLALCDGTAFRPIAGLRNHLFFYRRGAPDACADLRRLVEVAPEMFQDLASQVNGTLAFRARGVWYRPPTRMLSFRATPRAVPAALLPVFCRVSDPLGSAEAAIADAAVEEMPPLPPGPLRYVPLTEAALADAPFARVLAQRLLSAMLRDEPPLILELPLTAAGGDVADGIAAVIRALARTGVVFPRHVAASARWATGPLDAPMLNGASVLVHPGLDFWRIGRDVWDSVGEAEIVQDSPAGARFTRLFRTWLGAEIPTRLLRPRQERDQVSVGAVL